MRIQNLTCGAVPLFVLLLATSAFAQLSDTTGPTLSDAIGNAAADDTSATVSEAKGANQQAWGDMLHELQMLRTELQTLQTAVDGLQKNQTAIQDGLLRQLDINQRLEKQISELDYRLELAVKGSGGKVSGGDFAFVRPNMDDSRQMREFQKVVQGKVIFDNQTGQAQRIFINGAEWEVITGRSSMFVPYGLVTIHTRAGADNSLTSFQLDNWTNENEQLVLNVPLMESPQSPTPAQ